MRKIYIVTLTREERATLRELISSGKATARKLSHARILLKADSSKGGLLKEFAKGSLKSLWKLHWVGAAPEENTSENLMVMARLT